MALLAALLLSTKAIFAKLAYQEGVVALGLLFWRMIFSLPFFLIILARSTKVKPTTPEWLAMIVLGALGYYCSSFFDFKGLEYLDASLERLILFTYPTIVVLLRIVFFKKKITKPILLSLLVTYIGLILVFSDGLMISAMLSNNDLLTGIGWVELAACTYAIYLVGSERLMPRLGVNFFTSLAMIVSTVFVIMHTSIAIGQIPLYSLAAYGWIACIALFATVAPIYLISYSIIAIGASRMAIVGSIGPVFTIILAFYILGERLSLMQILGGILIIVSIGIITQKKNRK